MKSSFCRLLALVFLTIALSTCKKSSPQPAVATSTMSFYLDGVEHNMTNVTAINIYDHLTITGFTQNEFLSFQIDQINTGATVSAGLTPTPYEYLEISYTTSNFNSDFYFSFYSNGLPPSAQVTPVNITSLTSNSIEGTFTCSLPSSIVFNNSTVKNFTQGKFKCTITQQ